MKLYLSSYRIPDSKPLIELLGKQPASTRVILIPNAKDYYAPRARAVKVRHVVEALQKLGFTVDSIDLYDYRGKETELAHKLGQYDMIWVMGGNMFCLREAMYHSKFDKVIKDVLKKGVVFGGESAGACIAGTSLRGIEFGDDPEFAETVMWDGLGLTPHIFVPHMDNPDFGPYAQKMFEVVQDDPTVVQLNDNQAWVVDGQIERKITGPKPEEIVD
jgi:dipeptidase E